MVAYALWGVLPLYWKLLARVPAGELLAHRVVWSFAALLLWLLLSGRARALWAALSWRVLGIYTVTSLLIGTNWLLYVWAVNAGRVVEVSLGYFVNPLVSVVFGVTLLGEHLSRPQWIGVAVAGAGVGWLVVGSGSLPWVSLVLAASFAGYGLVKKLAPLGAMDGLLLETAILTPPAALALLATWQADRIALLRYGPSFDLLLLCAGLATSAPLALFGVAARRIPLSLLGLLQYLAPSMQLALGVIVFGEPFGPVRAAAFGLVWAGLAIFTLPGLARLRQRA